ncbi:hypothetical protein SESBI_21216 [Sesbania bispinosa]|nr:hypothetical protein SESBI_21216 [Sesbania bispinosa]
MAKESLCAKKKECGNGKMMMMKNLDPEGGSITISFLKSQCNEESKKSLKRKRENQGNVANKNCKTNNNSNIANVNDVILDQPVGLPMTFQERFKKWEAVR